ncbi:probable E3 ubiquitin-protein ligase DTX3 [Ruditapes philippinarum]|uniref:probable E3 ubiquitin-protein ligase DTX3 n=1 Tax=Ruditapes philippinarum TaxID=129788 RepID=UPI00295B2D03|nr:probable E3 ubiquitin-protein ligase DTX3 [Ruditapes philippinarum]
MAASLNEVETFDKSVLQRLFPDISVKQKNHKDWMTDFEKQIDSHLKTLKSSSIKSEGRVRELEATVKINKEEQSYLVDKLQNLINYKHAEEKKWQESLKAKELELQQAKKEVLKSKEEVLKAAGNQKDKYCMKCMDTITDPVRLNCGHNFCKGCIDAQFKSKPACPTCGHVCGIIIGDQPNGDMRYIVEKKTDCAGYEGYGMIVITYIFPSGRQGPDHPSPGTTYRGVTSVAYLPNNDEGRKILAMLEIAFKRKLVFTIGNSRTTGQEGVITWTDIHHKTNPGPNQQNGYPDPGYFERVKNDLAVKGVTERDIPRQ